MSNAASPAASPARTTRARDRVVCSMFLDNGECRPERRVSSADATALEALARRGLAESTFGRLTPAGVEFRAAAVARRMARRAANDVRPPARQCRCCGQRTDLMRCDTPTCNGARTEAIGIRPGSKRGAR